MSQSPGPSHDAEDAQGGRHTHDASGGDDPAGHPHSADSESDASHGGDSGPEPADGRGTVPSADGGTIVLAATPLGDTDDASQRLRQLLATADLIAAEDTRRLRRLARDLQIPVRGKVVSSYEAVEEERAGQLVAAAAAGDLVVVLSDAGTPLISDPGYRVVQAAVAADVRVSVAPGPSAVTAALAVAGLPTDRFCFEGFLPRKSGPRQRRLADLATEERTMVFFESPRRTMATLTDLAEAFGRDRPAVVCRELTKTHEEVRRGALGDLTDGMTEPVLGEVTLVVAGFRGSEAPAEPADLSQAYHLAVASGLDRKAAMKQVAQEYSVSRRDVYDAVLADRASHDSPST